MSTDFYRKYRPENGGPCAGCEQAPVCKVDQLACDDFVVFVGSGRMVAKQRNPTREIYRSLYPV